jgi:hypothetical protein
MTRVRSLVLGSVAAALVMGGAVSKSFAIEIGTFTNNLTGGSIGLPLGAAPPPGVYSGFESLYGAPGGQNGNNVGNQGLNNNGVNQPLGTPNSSRVESVFIGIVPIVWATGYNVFGGNLTLNAVQAFYTASVDGPGIPVPGANFNGLLANGNPPFVGITSPTIANTTWGGSLSWNLGQGWFFAAGFAFEAPDGSRYQATFNPDYWSFEPTWAISYIANNWVLSANFAYFFNTASRGTCCFLQNAAGNGYLNGQELYVDLTALYKIGKWEIGPVASIVTQTTADQPGSGFTCATMAALNPGDQCGRENRIRVGGLIGYDFGLVSLQAWVTDDVYCRDVAACGVAVWSRLGFKIWGPEAPKPLVAKN